MVEITTLDGQVIEASDSSIVLIAGPYPHDVGPHTYVYGVTPAVLVTGEAPGALIARLNINPLLARLTRPNQTSVWIKGAAVTSLRRPVSSEITNPGEVNAIVNIGSLHQAVRETVETARSIINALGGQV